MRYEFVHEYEGSEAVLIVNELGGKSYLLISCNDSHATCGNLHD